MNNIILASGSPRRKDLLQDLGLDFTIQISDCDEAMLPKESPSELVLRLAKLKALTVAKNNQSSYVIGADTIVVVDGNVLGKPSDLNQAKVFINQLAAKTHLVLSAYAIINLSQNIEIVKLSVSYVRFSKLSEKRIDHYLKNANCLDKAGAYAIQEHAASLVESINGNFSTIVGLDITKLAKDLELLNLL